MDTIYRVVNRVNRGGNWNNNTENCRVAIRNNNNPTNHNNNIGFRLVSQLNRMDGCLLLNQIVSCIGTAYRILTEDRAISSVSWRKSLYNFVSIILNHIFNLYHNMTLSTLNSRNSPLSTFNSINSPLSTFNFQLKKLSPLHSRKLSTLNSQLSTQETFNFQLKKLSTFNSINSQLSTPLRIFILFILSTLNFTLSILNSPLSTLSAQTAWKPATSPTTATLYDVYFPTNDVGYAVGASGTIIKSIDGGKTFSPQSSEVTTTLRAVYFVDETTGYAIGDGGTWVKTMNGGGTWIAKVESDGVNLKDVFFTDKNNGIIVGECGKIITTTNGGGIWNPKSVTDGNYNNNSLCRLNNQYYIASSNKKILSGDISFGFSDLTGNDAYNWIGIDSKKGNIATVNSLGNLAYSGDGSNWTLSLNVFPNASALSMIEDGTIYVACKDSMVWRKTISGAKEDFSTGISSQLHGIYMSSDKRGWAVGDDGKVYYYQGCPDIGYTAKVSRTAICANDTFSITINQLSNITPPFTVSIKNQDYIVQHNDTTFIFTPVDTTDYVISLKDILGCRADKETSISITVNPLPDATIIGEKSYCKGDKVTLSAVNTTAKEYLWSNGDNDKTTNFVADIVEDRTYTLTVTDQNNCVDSSNIKITVNKIPTVTITDQTSNEDDCERTEATLKASGADSFMWNDGTHGAEYKVYKSGTYSVEGTSNGCKGDTSIAIFISNLNVSIDPIRDSIVENMPFRISASVSGGHSPYTVEWTTDAGYVTHNDSLKTSATMRQDGKLTVTVTDFIGCSVSKSLDITVRSVVTDGEVISPDKPLVFDEVNNPDNKKNEIYIFTRWGQVVYHAQPYRNDWKGETQSGQRLPDGTYYYKILFNDKNNKHQWGYLTLVRGE